LIATEVDRQKFLNSELKYYRLLFLIPVFLLFDLSIVINISLIFCFVYFLTSQSLKIITPDLLLWVSLILWGIYTVIISPVLSTGLLHYSLIIISPFLIFILVINIENSEFYKFLKNFMDFSLIAGCIISFYSIFTFYEIGFKFSMRIPSFWQHYNLVAAFLMLLIIFNISILIYSKDTSKKIYILSLLILITGLILTQTRAVLLGVVLALIIFIFKKPRLIIPISIFFFIAVFLFWGLITDRLTSVINFYADISTLGRIQAWLTSIELIKENLLLGYGFDSYIKLRDTVFSNYFVVTNHSHSTYLGLILELGLIGFLLYFSFYIKAIYYSFFSRKIKNNFFPFVAGLQASLLVLLIIFFFEPYFTPFGAITVFIWFLISVSYKIHSINLNNPEY